MSDEVPDLPELAPAVASVRGGPLGRGFRPPVAAAAVVVVGLLVFGAISTRTLGGRPRATGPVSATDTKGPFELTIRSPKGEYTPIDAIDISATLSYLGADASVDISHDGGGVDPQPTPIRFGIEEPVLGDIQIQPISRLVCGRSILRKDSPEVASFSKSGSFSGNDPLASAGRAFFENPVLQLPAGTWHVYAEAVFGVGNDCGGSTMHLRATITIIIPAADGSVPTAPLPTPTMNPLDLPVGDDTQDGPIQLTLTSPHGRYKAGDPIDIAAGLAQGDDGTGRGPITTYGGSDGPVVFRLHQVDGPIDIEPIQLADCVEQVTLPLYEPLRVPFKKSGTVPDGASDPDYWNAWFGDPVLRLPAGTWQITALPNFAGVGGCGTPGPNLQPTITITVTP